METIKSNYGLAPLDRLRSCDLPSHLVCGTLQTYAIYNRIGGFLLNYIIFNYLQLVKFFWDADYHGYMRLVV